MKSQQSEKQPGDIDLTVYKQLFLEQAQIFLEMLRTSLRQLQENPHDSGAFSEGRRATHTLKGMAATMHYQSLTEMATRLEGPFLASGSLSPLQMDALLAGCDAFEAGLARLARENEG